MLSRLPVARVQYHPEMINSTVWPQNSVWEDLTIAMGCGDEVPQGECHPFCSECVIYAGFQPCCIDDRPLCSRGQMMSPTAIFKRMYDAMDFRKNFERGMPRVRRTVLRPQRVEPTTTSPSTSHSNSLTVPEAAIARACEQVVAQAGAPYRRPKIGPRDIHHPPQYRPQSVTPSFIPQPRVMRAPDTIPQRDTPSRLQQPRTITPQPSTSASSHQTTPVKTQEKHTPMSPLVETKSVHHSDLDNTQPISLPSAASASRVSKWADQQAMAMQADVSTANDRRSTSAASTLGYSQAIEISSRESSPVRDWFPRVDVQSTIPRKNPSKYYQVMEWMLMNPAPRRSSIRLPELITKPSPASKKQYVFTQVGDCFKWVDRYTLAMAEDMRAAGVRDLNYIPPARPLITRGAFTLAEPALQITALQFPDNETAPWCVKNVCPSLVCTMTHQELGEIEERIIFSIHSTVAAMRFLTAQQDHDTDKRTQLLTTRAPVVTVKAYHALHAVLAQVVAARRRDVIDTRSPVSHQLTLLQRPVSGSDALVEDF